MKLFYQLVIMFLLQLFDFIKPIKLHASFNSTTNANVIPTIIARKVMEFMKSNLILTAKCDHNWENELQDSGDTVTITKFAKPTVSNKVAGTPIATRQGVATTTVDVTLDQHFYSALAAEDTALLMSKPNAMDSILRGTAISMAEKIEEYIWGLIVTHGLTPGNNLGSFTTAIDRALLQEIKDSFDSAKVPAGYERLGILGTEGISDIMNINDVTYVSNMGKNQELGTMSTGKLQEYVLGVRYDLSQLEPVTVANRSGVAFVKPAIAVVNRPLRGTELNMSGVQIGTYFDPDLQMEIRVVQGYDMAYMGTTINIDCLMGAKIIIPEWVKEIRH